MPNDQTLRSKLIRLAHSMPSGSEKRRALLEVLAAPRRWKPPTPPFSRDEARIFANELTHPRYVKDARAWARHYSREAQKWEGEQRSWVREFGREDDNYAVAIEKTRWLASAWDQVAKAHGQ